MHIEKEKQDGSNNKNTDKNDETTDDETDDEGAVISASAPPCSSQASSVISMHLKNSDCITKHIDKNKSLLLPSLSVREGHKSDATVTVQIGNAFFKITRVPLEFCLSRLPTKEKKELQAMGPRIGARVTTVFDHESIKYLVCPDKASTAKFISAWALNVPAVTADFIHAFVNRTNAQDPLPKFQEYESPETELKFENDAVPEKRGRILGGYKVLSFMESEGELLCRCTGATIVPLYTEDGSARSDMQMWQNNKFWEELEAKQREDGLVVVWLDSASKKKKKEKDYLVKKMKAQSRNGGGLRISCINQNGVAHAISSGNFLCDVDGNELVPLKATGDNYLSSVVAISSSGGPTESQASSQKSSAPAESNHDDEMEVEMTEKDDSDTPAITPAVTESVEAGETAGDAEIISTSKKGRKRRTGKQTDYLSQNTWIQSSKSSKHISHESQTESNRSSTWMSSNRTNQKNGVDYEAAEAADIEMEEEEVDEDRGDKNISVKNKRKMKLPETGDGWLCAAPQGKKRKAFKRSRAELSAMGEMEFSEPAVTDFCGGLVVRSKNELERMSRAQSQNQTRKNNQHSQNITTNGTSVVKNFKRFKKNSIISGARMHSISQIRLVSVLPKESERQKELQAMHYEMDREQRESDMMFVDAEGVTGKKKKGGGIRSYFSSNGTTRGRGARRTN